VESLEKILTASVFPVGTYAYGHVLASIDGKMELELTI
jgi:hypothetical protein